MDAWARTLEIVIPISNPWVWIRLFVWVVGLFVCVVAAFGGPSGPGGGALESNASASAGI